MQCYTQVLNITKTRQGHDIVKGQGQGHDIVKGTKLENRLLFWKLQLVYYNWTFSHRFYVENKKLMLFVDLAML